MIISVVVVDEIILLIINIEKFGVIVIMLLLMINISNVYNNIGFDEKWFVNLIRIGLYIVNVKVYIVINWLMIVFDICKFWFIKFIIFVIIILIIFMIKIFKMNVNSCMIDNLKFFLNKIFDIYFF